MDPNSTSNSQSKLTQWWKSTIICKLYGELSRTSFAIFILFLISMLMQWATSQFEKDKYLENIQFGFPSEIKEFKTAQKALFEGIPFDEWYFITDMFFLISLYVVVFIFFNKIRGKRQNSPINYSKFKRWLYLLGGLSILCDWYENFQYLGLISGLPYFSFIEQIKIGFIALFFAVFILYLTLNYVNIADDQLKSRNTKKLLTIVKASFISIIMLIVLALGLTFLDQGATLVVHLLDEVMVSSKSGIIQVIVTVLLINLLAVMLSHYPEYIQNAMTTDQNTRWNINWWCGKYFNEIKKSADDPSTKKKDTGPITTKFIQLLTKIPGLITFTNIHYDDINNENSNNTDAESASVSDNDSFVKIDTFFRYCLGVMTYVAWFYVLYKAFDLYGLTTFNAGISVFLWSILVCLIIFYLFRIHQRDSQLLLKEIEKLKLKNAWEGHKMKISKEAIDKVRPWTKGYLILFLLTFVIGIWALCIFYCHGWHKKSFNISVVFLLVNTFLYVFFRFSRVYSKFVWFDADKVKSLLIKDHESSFIDTNNTVPFILENDANPYWYHKILGYVSSNYQFLFAICMSTIASGAFLIWTFLTMNSYITEFSTIPMLLALLAVLNIIIVYPVKLFLAYGRRQNIGVIEKRSKDESDTKDKGKEPIAEFRRRKTKLITASFFAIIGLALLNIFSNIDNLHKLYYVEATDIMTIEEFSKNLEGHILNDIGNDCDKIRPLIQISSFGGGLKSNLWTLLVMDTLDDLLKEKLGKKDHRILDYTISLSGVSGGAVGLGNYMVLDYMSRTLDDYDKKSIIQKIGKENILAIDAAGIFGHDRIRGIISWCSNSDDFNCDRSYYAMVRYMKILSRTNGENAKAKDKNEYQYLSNASLAEYWRTMTEGVKYNPALIINTASTGAKPGVSFSLVSESITFPGYISLSKVDSLHYKDLKYYDAVGTSNRFPIMSPAAQVEDDGHFLDGGYFENSGLLTSSQFLKELKVSFIKDTTLNFSENFENYPIGMVSIINSKSDYIRKFIETNNIELIKVNGSTNSAAVLSGITNIDKLPNVLLNTAKTYTTEEDKFFTIYMPHPISINEIQNVLGGDIKINKELIDAIDINNSLIDSVLREFHGSIITLRGVVVPPLARTLSKPAVDYETAMIMHHDSVKQMIDSVINYIVNCPVNTNSQNEISDSTNESSQNEYKEAFPEEVSDQVSDQAKKEQIIKSLPKKTLIKRSKKKDPFNE